MADPCSPMKSSCHTRLPLLKVHATKKGQMGSPWFYTPSTSFPPHSHSQVHCTGAHMHTHSTPPPPVHHKHNQTTHVHNTHTIMTLYIWAHTNTYIYNVYACWALIHIAVHLHYILVFMKKIEWPCLIHRQEVYKWQEQSLQILRSRGG